MIVTSMLSNWYSGATLLARVLNRHPDLLCNGESFPFSPEDETRYDCSCGQFLEECAFYGSAAAHMRSAADGSWRRDVFSQVPRYADSRLANAFLLSPRFDSPLRQLLIRSTPRLRSTQSGFVDAHVEFMQNALTYSNKSVYVDGTKSIRRAQLFAHSPSIDLRVMHLIRDPRGFCCSFLRNRGLGKDDLLRATREWSSYVQLVESIQKRRRELPMITVRYEDLCSDTEGTLRKLHDFLGIPHHDLHKPERHESHILGNRMRRSSIGKISEDRRWLSFFDGDELERIAAAVGRRSQKYGYDLSGVPGR